MHYFKQSCRREALCVTLAALLATLAGCATGQGGGSQTAATAAVTGTGSTTSSGRLDVYVTDQNGRVLERATVDVSSDTGYRRSSYTDSGGKTTFTNVPEVVNVEVIHQAGSYSAGFIVAQSGTSEMRIIVNVLEAEEAGSEADQGTGGY